MGLAVNNRFLVRVSSKLPKCVAMFPQVTRREKEDCRHEKWQDALNRGIVVWLAHFAGEHAIGF